MIAVRLPRTYDTELLVRDLERLRALPQVPQSGPYHDGDWTGLDLYTQAGGSDRQPHPQLHPFAPTEALRHAPYLAEIIAELDCPKMMVRLLTLPPGSEIGEHNDAGSNFQFGSLRLHVPVVTDRNVVMVIDGERMRWQPGELWWGDFSRRHWLRNDSDVTRVHLVMDVQINQFVLDLFPPELVAAKHAEGYGISMCHAAIPSTDAQLTGFACEFSLPGSVTPLFIGGRSLQEASRPASARCRPEGGRLVVTVDGAPVFALKRIGPADFAMVGQPPGIVIEFDSPTRPTRVDLVIRGVPEDLYAAQLGYQRGPIIPEQRFSMPLAAGTVNRA